MAFYTSGINRITGYEELPVLEGYFGTVGASQITLESIQNDMALFEALIVTDFQEISMMSESASESELNSLLESSSVGFIDKIKEYLGKVWAKIKGLIKSFTVNLVNIVIRDNKKFVEKYKDSVSKKDLSGLKYKWSEHRKNKDGVFGGDISPIRFSYTNTNIDTLYNFSKLFNNSLENLDKIIDKTKATKTEDLSKLLGLKSKTTFAEVLKDFREAHYRDVEEVEGLNSQRLMNIMETLTSSNDLITSFNKCESDTTKMYNDRIKELESARTTLAKLLPGGGTANIDNSGDRKYNKEEIARANKALNALYTMIQVEQECVTKAIGVLFQITKWKIKECRSVFARAAAYNPRRENFDFMEGLDDEAYHEVEELFEGTYAY